MLQKGPKYHKSHPEIEHLRIKKCISTVAIKSKVSNVYENFHFWVKSFNSVVECVCIFTLIGIINREQLWENTEHILCSKPHAWKEVGWRPKHQMIMMMIEITELF